ncbi:MAG: YfhO family protein [Firmicutes bacterium]|nr:YfhO family protein [Bacillota bacterium]
MKGITKKHWKTIWEYSLPPLVTLVLLSVFLAVKGVYPFGGGAVGLIDYYHGLVPSYTYLWDMLHGNASIFYSSALGGGGNIFASGIMNSFLCPILWLVALFPRETLAFNIVFIIAILFLIIAFTSYFCFKRLFPNVNKYYLLFFSIMWTFSAWMLVHYTNVGWLTIIALFPLLVLALRYLIQKNKITPFVIVFAYSLMLSYYISFMILVALVAVALIYILMLVKENKKKTAAALGYGLIFSLLISMIAFAPSLIAGLGSFRIDSGGSAQVLYENFGSKLFMIIAFPLPLVLIAMYFIKHFKTDKRMALVFIAVLAVLLSGLVFERINAMWHTGSYYSFPYRYSFVILFALLFMALYYINKFDWRHDFKEIKSKFISALLIPGFAVTYIFLSLVSLGLNHPYQTLSLATTLLVLALSGTGAALYVLFLKQKRTTLKHIGVCAVAFVTIFSLTFAYFGDRFYEEHHNQIQTNFSISTSGLELPYRIKDKDNVLYPNYPLMLNYPSLSTWIHISPNDQTLAYRYLGYNEYGVVLTDQGGSLFSDLLLGNRYVLSLDPSLSSVVYTKIDEFQGAENKLYMYEHNFTLPYVQLFDKALDISELNESSILDAQNEIYQALLGTNQNIINTIPFVSEAVGEDMKITVNVTELQNLYLQFPYGTKAFLLVDDDNKIAINNGLFDLGIFEDETVEFLISVDSLEDAQLSTIKIADVQNLSHVANNNFANYQITRSGIKFTITSAGSSQAFVPITWLADYSVKVNGQVGEISKAFTSFVVVQLHDGANVIEVDFTPQLFNVGALISIIALILVIALYILNRFFRLLDKRTFQWIGTSLGGIIVLAIGFLVFLQPFALTFVDLFHAIFKP